MSRIKPDRIDPWKLARDLSAHYRSSARRQHDLYMAAAGAAYYGALGPEDCGALYGEYCGFSIAPTALSFRTNASKLRCIVKLVKAAPEMGCDLLRRAADKWHTLPEPGAALADSLVAVSRYQLRRLGQPLSDRALVRFLRKTKG